MSGLVRREAQVALGDARRRMLEVMAETRTTVQRKTGFELKSPWVIPLFAAALGVAAGVALRARRPRRKIAS